MDTTIQTEKSYQKQPVIFLGNKKALLTKAKSGSLTEAEKKKLRYWKSVGLGFETPKAAIDGTYIDNYCPFTSSVSIRGKILRGSIKSNKMTRTIIMRRDYLKFVRKYNRYEKRHKNVPCHISPAFGAPQEGDQVVVGECRPISKTIRFNVLKVVPKGGRKKFNAY